MKKISEEETKKLIEEGKEELEKIIAEGGKVTTTIINEKEKVTIIKKVELVNGKATSSTTVKTKDETQLDYSFIV